MTWLDVLIIVVTGVAALMGAKTGLIGALFTVGAVLIGWLLAGRWADNIGGLFGDSLSNDTIVTVISYAIILAVTVFLGRVVARVVRPILGLVTLGMSGMVDKLGGLALGVLVGVFLAGATFMGLARLAYNFEVEELGEDIAAVATERLQQVDEVGNVVESVLSVSTTAPIFDQVREGVESALMDSTSAPLFVDVATALPGSTLGFVPDDFKVALEILDHRITESEGSP